MKVIVESLFSICVLACANLFTALTVFYLFSAEVPQLCACAFAGAFCHLYARTREPLNLEIHISEKSARTPNKRRDGNIEWDV